MQRQRHSRLREIVACSRIRHAETPAKDFAGKAIAEQQSTPVYRRRDMVKALISWGNGDSV
jgi:hypothetical protein